MLFIFFNVFYFSTVELRWQHDRRGGAESALKETMDGFQQNAAEQHDRVNGYCKPKSPQDTTDVRWTATEAESGASDSCEGTSVSELTDLQELKSRDNEEEEDKEEDDAGPASKGLKGDQQKREKESPDRKENDHGKQNSSAASSYTGKEMLFLIR